MPKTLDESELLLTFKTEADEYLAQLTQAMLSLEKNPDQPAVIQEIFRVAHSLKGAAAMVGFDDIKQIAHNLEDQLKKVKDGQLAFTTHVADQSLAALDNITSILETRLQAKPAEPAPNVPKPAPDPESQAAARADEFIRIPLSRINALFNLVGELVIHKVKSSYKLGALRQLRRHIKRHGVESEAFKKRVLELAELITAETMHLDPVIDELQYRVRELRMLPCSTIFDGFERMVRDLANQQKKSVAFVVQGEDTELDKKMLEALKPCLIHLLRNAVDHGIESPAEREAAGKPPQGTIWVRAAQQGGHAVIEVQEDGRGINVDRIKQVALRKGLLSEEEASRMDDAQVRELIFAPGFSTSPLITDVSGRGVGLDVVKKAAETLGGSVWVHSQLGQGTTVRIELPLTLAILGALLIEANGQKFGLPLLAIEEIVRIQPTQVQTINERMAISLRARTVPLVRLSDVLALPGQPRDAKANGKVKTKDWPVVIAASAERRVGLIVDAVVGVEEIFIKSLGAHLGTLPSVSGASILGTGEVIVILDAQDLLAASRQARTSVAAQPTPTAKEIPQRRILLVEDSLTTREFERSLLEAHGYVVETAVDGVDGLEKIRANHKFDLVVTDIEMPRMNGFDFCQALRQQPELQELPIVVVTTMDKEEEKRRGIEAGAQAYIIKGAFNQNALLQTIERLVGTVE